MLLKNILVYNFASKKMKLIVKISISERQGQDQNQDQNQNQNQDQDQDQNQNQNPMKNFVEIQIDCETYCEADNDADIGFIRITPLHQRLK